MMDEIYAKFNDDGFVVGFWQSAAYSPPAEGEDRNPIIPADAIKITEAQFDEFFNNPQTRKWQDGKIVPYEPPPASVSPEQIDAERDNRTANGFKFKNRLYQLRPGDVQNITGAALAASMAITNGAQPGDLRWFDPDNDFGWIATNNGIVPMDAHTVIEFANAAMAWRSGLIFKARAIKDRINAGEVITDATDEALWSDPV